MFEIQLISSPCHKWLSDLQPKYNAMSLQVTRPKVAHRIHRHCGYPLLYSNSMLSRQPWHFAKTLVLWLVAPCRHVQIIGQLPSAVCLFWNAIKQRSISMDLYIHTENCKYILYNKNTTRITMPTHNTDTLARSKHHSHAKSMSIERCWFIITYHYISVFRIAQYTLHSFYGLLKSLSTSL